MLTPGGSVVQSWCPLSAHTWLGRKSEHREQAGVSERGNPADPAVGHGQHADTVRPQLPVSVPRVHRRGGLAVGASGQHPPVAGRAKDAVAQERDAGTAAREPGPQRRRLQDDVLDQQPLEGGGVRVLERGDVLIQQRPRLRQVRLGEEEGPDLRKLRRDGGI